MNQRHLPGLAGGLLALVALTEAVVARGPVFHVAGARPQVIIVLGLLAVFGTLPALLLRPVAAGVTVTAASALALAIVHTVTVAGIVAQLIGVFRAARTGAMAVPMAAGAPFLVLALLDPGGPSFRARAVLLAALVPAAALAGALLRARGADAANSATRAVMAGTLLEHTVRGERVRIARELHDVVGHHISMIAVQAETARLTTAGLSAAGARQLLGIGDTARAALTEMRRLLGVLREDAPAAAVAQRQPQPELAQLNDLLDQARDASGTAARLIVRGPVSRLDPGVELTAYRIVQESLTNARRHAPGAAIDVELCYRDDGLWLRVRDNGPGPSPGRAEKSGGHGLLGMRERAAAVGGEVRTGPADGNGFLVEASLPAQTAGLPAQTAGLPAQTGDAR